MWKQWNVYKLTAEHELFMVEISNVEMSETIVIIHICHILMIFSLLNVLCTFIININEYISE